MCFINYLGSLIVASIAYVVVVVVVVVVTIENYAKGCDYGHHIIVHSGKTLTRLLWL